VRRRELFELLARAVGRPEQFAAVRLAPCDVDGLVALALEHRVAGQLGPAFAAAGRPLPDAVGRARQQATLGHLQKLQALQRATEALDRAGLAALVVKGPVLAAGWYGDPASRRYHDLDVLVDPVGFAAAIDALVGAGFAEQNRNWAGYRSLGMGEVPLDDGTVSIDLHWHLVTFAADRTSFGFHTAALLEARRPIRLGSVSTHRLSDEDTLAHTVLHAGLAGARLLIHQRDVHVVASAVDTATAARRMDELGMARLASATLDRVRRTLGPLDPSLESVRAPVWQGVNGAIDRAWAVAAPRARNAFPSAVLSAGRSTVAGTVRALRVQTVRAAGRRMGLPTFTSPGGALDVDLDAGGPRERDRFLADVEHGRFGR
jgi:hypothetical protein